MGRKRIPNVPGASVGVVNSEGRGALSQRLAGTGTALIYGASRSSVATDETCSFIDSRSLVGSGM